MKKDRNLTKLIAWLAFGIAIGTSIIRLYLLNIQSSSSISSSTINSVSYLGYAIVLLLLLLFWYKKRRL